MEKKMSDDWFIINDLDSFTEKSRIMIYRNFGSWSKDSEPIVVSTDIEEKDKEDLDHTLSHQESLIIVKQFVKKQKNTKTNKVRYLLNDDLFIEILSSLNDRMVSNILNRLVQKGLIESAFDSKTNDFIFWITENGKNELEKPETD